MRKIFFFCLLLFFTTAVFSQQNQNSRPLTKAELLKKSRTQKTVGFVLLGVGAATIAILAPGNTDLDAVGPLAIGAGACILGSIPLFIAASKNKKRAMAMSAFIELERLPRLHQGIAVHSLPALGIKISLK